MSWRNGIPWKNGIPWNENIPRKEGIPQEEEILQKEGIPQKKDILENEDIPQKKVILEKKDIPQKKVILEKKDMTARKNISRKDILQKILLSHGDVFADCENVFSYGGERRLRGEDLRPAPTESFYRGTDGMHSQFSDVSSYLVQDGQIQIQFIIGNETGLEGRQVLRKASYQGGAYRAQLESGQPVYPVIGMVIDWTRRGTRIPLSLHELLLREGVSAENLSRVDDVKLEVHHMNNLSKEVRR